MQRTDNHQAMKNLNVMLCPGKAFNEQLACHVGCSVIRT